MRKHKLNNLHGFLEEIYYALYSAIRTNPIDIANRRKIDTKVVELLKKHDIISENKGLFQWVDLKVIPSRELAIGLSKMLYGETSNGNLALTLPKGDMMILGNKAIMGYEQAKQAIKGFNIKRPIDYERAFKRGKLPQGLPANPYHAYRYRGQWLGWKDFLGTSS